MAVYYWPEFWASPQEYENQRTKKRKRMLWRAYNYWLWVVGYHCGSPWDYDMPKSKTPFQMRLFQGAKAITEECSRHCFPE